MKTIAREIKRTKENNKSFLNQKVMGLCCLVMGLIFTILDPEDCGGGLLLMSLGLGLFVTKKDVLNYNIDEEY